MNSYDLFSIPSRSERVLIVFVNQLALTLSLLCLDNFSTISNEYDNFQSSLGFFPILLYFHKLLEISQSSCYVYSLKIFE